MIYLYEVWGAALGEAGQASSRGRFLLGGVFTPVTGTLANWQADGFNKPQRSGFIRTCPDRSTGSKPLVAKTPDEVSQGRFDQGTLKRILKRISRVTISVSRLAYIEHKHRSHRFFQANFFTRPSYGDDAKVARSVGNPAGPGIVPDRAHAVTRSFPPRQATRSFEFQHACPKPRFADTDPAPVRLAPLAPN